MFERFLNSFQVTSGEALTRLQVESVSDLISMAGGRAFDDGLYRIHSTAQASVADSRVADAFPEFVGRFACFGCDWLGRQFATDSTRGHTNDPEILLFEPGTGQALSIPVSFSKFHDDELVDEGEAALARGLFGQWRAAGGAAPGVDECIGYRVPLFLDGRDELENLELTDLEVYWSVVGQLRRQVLG